MAVFPPTDWGDWTPEEYQVGAPATALHFERWFRNVVAAFQGHPDAPRLEDAALDSTVTSAGETWVAARMIARTHGGIGTLAFAERYGSAGMATTFGASVAGSELRTTNVSVNNTVTVLSGTWRCLGGTASRSAGGGREAVAATLWQRVA